MGQGMFFLHPLAIGAWCYKPVVLISSLVVVTLAGYGLVVAAGFFIGLTTACEGICGKSAGATSWTFRSASITW